MKTTVKRTLLTALTALCSLSALTFDATAQNVSDTLKYPEQRKTDKLVRNTKVVFVDGEGRSNPDLDSAYNLINQFYIDQFRHSQDPAAPYFMFMSKSSNMALGVGGLVRMRGWYDWNGSVPGSGFSIYSIPVPKNPASRRDLDATPSGTSFFFTLLGKNQLFGSYQAFIQAQFSGFNNVGFRLKKAYVTARDWTVGYATSTFADPAAQPITIDGAGPNGWISRTNVLVRYMHTFRKHWTVAGSFEFPKSQADVDDKYTEKCNDYFPDLAAFGQYQWDDGLSHVRLSGLLRVIPYRDLQAAKNRSVVGWGAQLSSVFKVISPLMMFATAGIGQGHGSYTGDLSIGNYDLVADPHNPYRLYAPTSLSLTYGAKYNFTDNIYSCITLAMQRYYPKENPGNNEYKYGQYLAVNLFWDITPRCEIGAEYLAGKKMEFNGAHANANRVTAMFQLSF